MDHLRKRRSRARLLHRTWEGTLLKGGKCNAGNVVRDELRKRTLAKSQHLLVVKRPLGEPRRDNLIHMPVYIPEIRLQTRCARALRRPHLRVYSERPRTAYLCNGRSAPEDEEASATGCGGAVATQPHRRRHPGHLWTRVTASRTQHLQHTTSIKKRC